MTGGAARFGGARTGWAARRRALRLAWWRHRRLGSLLALGLALAIGVRVAQPGGPQLRPVPVLSHTLGAGAVISADDVRTVAWPASALPTGLLRDPVGRTLAGPARRGEALTDARVVGRSLLAGQPEGVVAVSVHPADLAWPSLVRPGDRVDVFAAEATEPSGDAAAPDGDRVADRVAAAAMVLAVGGTAADGTDESGGGSGSPGGGLGLLDGAGSGSGASSPAGLVLAVDGVTAARLAAAAGASVISVALLPDRASSLPGPARASFGG